MNRPGTPWRRAARGLLLIGLGVFLLGNTMGLLDWSFWMDLAGFWPVALVALGLRVVFERSRAPWGVLLSPLLILGTMVWVALGGPPCASGRLVAVRAERPAGITRWALDGGLAYARLDLAAHTLAPDLLVQGGATTGSGRPAIRSSRGSGSARVSFTGTDRRWRLGSVRWQPDRWRLEVAQDLPLSVNLDLALLKGEMDLAAVPVTSLSLDAAFTDLVIRLGEPEREVFLTLDSAFSRYELVVPENVPVRVASSGLMGWTSGERGGTAPGYRVRLDGAFNRLLVRRR
ncbi:MAG: LiaI-LiaF-like domain-containing protein [Acidobacteriota bacterium]